MMLIGYILISYSSYHITNLAIRFCFFILRLTLDCVISVEQEGKADKLAMTSELLELKYQEGVPSFKFAYGQNTYFLSFAGQFCWSPLWHKLCVSYLCGS